MKAYTERECRKVFYNIKMRECELNAKVTSFAHGIGTALR